MKRLSLCLNQLNQCSAVNELPAILYECQFCPVPLKFPTLEESNASPIMTGSLHFANKPNPIKKQKSAICRHENLNYFCCPLCQISLENNTFNISDTFTCRNKRRVKKTCHFSKVQLLHCDSNVLPGLK